MVFASDMDPKQERSSWALSFSPELALWIDLLHRWAFLRGGKHDLEQLQAYSLLEGSLQSEEHHSSPKGL